MKACARIVQPALTTRPIKAVQPLLPCALDVPLGSLPVFPAPRMSLPVLDARQDRRQRQWEPATSARALCALPTRTPPAAVPRAFRVLKHQPPQQAQRARMHATFRKASCSTCCAPSMLSLLRVSKWRRGRSNLRATRLPGRYRRTANLSTRLEAAHRKPAPPPKRAQGLRAPLQSLLGEVIYNRAMTQLKAKDAALSTAVKVVRKLVMALPAIHLLPRARHPPPHGVAGISHKRVRRQKQRLGLSLQRLGLSLLATKGRGGGMRRRGLRKRRGRRHRGGVMLRSSTPCQGRESMA